jgi:hypothetical protein
MSINSRGRTHRYPAEKSALDENLEKCAFLRGFLKSDEFGSRGGHTLRFEEKVMTRDRLEYPGATLCFYQKSLQSLDRFLQISMCR